MITPTPLSAQPDSWQNELAQAISDPATLLEMLDLPQTLLKPALAAARSFPLRVTHHYLGLIRRGDPHDPLLRQVLPLAEELGNSPGYVADPVGDRNAGLGHGLLQKYRGRALIVATGACAIHCRYCFRRDFPYAGETAMRHWHTLPRTLAAMPETSEVILSGGDPLTLSDRRLKGLLDRLNDIPHLRRFRIHSRMPCVVPSRITSSLVDLLTASRLQTSMVLHCNHARELSPALREALGPLKQANVTLLNQSVLLKGVNDSVETLCELSEQLYDHGILPYYLHALDRVTGSAHFDLPDDKARALHRDLQNLLPGYLVPRLVREVAGAPSKTPLI